jgi:hypothetical protein
VLASVLIVIAALAVFAIAAAAVGTFQDGAGPVWTSSFASIRRAHSGRSSD